MEGQGLETDFLNEEIAFSILEIPKILAVALTMLRHHVASPCGSRRVQNENVSGPPHLGIHNGMAEGFRRDCLRYADVEHPNRNPITVQQGLIRSHVPCIDHEGPSYECFAAQNGGDYRIGLPIRR